MGSHKYRRLLLKALKIAAGSGMAIIAAELLGLSYATSAGIITLLTVQDTRQDTIQLTVDRILSFLLCVGLIYACFHFPPAGWVNYIVYSSPTLPVGELYTIYLTDGSMLLPFQLAEYHFGQCGNGYTLPDDAGLQPEFRTE